MNKLLTTFAAGSAALVMSASAFAADVTMRNFTATADEKPFGTEPSAF
jgi:hypothetical protein